MHLRLSLLLALLVAAPASTLWPGRADAQVRRCVMPDGQVTFTDRKCAEVGATERLPREQSAQGARLHRTAGCARTLQDLVFEMTTAIDSRDANRLAGVYHWTGLPGDDAYRILARLDAIASRPLVDIVPVMPAPAEPAIAADAAGIEGVDTGASSTAATPMPAIDGDLYPQTTIRRNPVALRVEQTLGTSATPARTVFGLARHFGCWWVRF